MASKTVLLPALTAIALAAGLSGCKGSNEDSPFFAQIKARHDNFEEIGDAYKAIRNEAKKGSPDYAEISGKAALINANAGKIAPLFPAGSGKESGVKTEALATVWSKPDDFQKGIEKLIATSATLKAAADAKDAAAVTQAVDEVGAACKGCHDVFREKD